MRRKFCDATVSAHETFDYILGAHPLVVLTAPVIYSLIFPLLLLDMFVTVYQAICFPGYGIAK